MEDKYRGCVWSEEETKILIQVWGEPEFQERLRGQQRNFLVFGEIARVLNEQHNIARTAVQCRDKIKKLKQAFRSAEDNNRKSGSGRKECPHYAMLAPTLGGRPSSNPRHLVSSQSQASAASQDSQHLSVSQTSLKDDFTLNESDLDEDEKDTTIDPRTLARGGNTPSASSRSSVTPEPRASTSTDNTGDLPAVPPPKKRARKSKITVDSEASDLKEIACAAMKTAVEAFNKAEDKRLEKILQLEKKRQRSERKHDRFMETIFSHLLGGSGGGFFQRDDSDSDEDSSCSGTSVSDVVSGANLVLYR